MYAKIKLKRKEAFCSLLHAVGDKKVLDAFIICRRAIGLPDAGKDLQAVGIWNLFDADFAETCKHLQPSDPHAGIKYCIFKQFLPNLSIF